MCEIILKMGKYLMKLGRIEMYCLIFMDHLVYNHFVGKIK